FLRGAKATFIRLQAANDRKDLDDIREYTTPEVFAEIALQMQERGDAVQKTDVLQLDAQVLEVVTEGDFTVASVRFTGELAENGGAAEPFDEIWNVQHDTRRENSGWLLAGIQQTN
ncbi:MAG TPA: Tim44-like domain-containing protein, partial [Methylophilaceae bacterium]|nr:Tim44-like domain-containing protein [Methylophilaceae bacterium]